MPDVVLSVENLSKFYTIGRHSDPLKSFTSQWDASNLRSEIKRGVKNIVRRSMSAMRGEVILQGSFFEKFWALQDVSFQVARGEVVGVIGRNGAGKSTLLKILSRITEPSGGRVALDGRLASLLEVGTGFHPELTGRENIFLNGAILGMSRSEIRRKFDEIVEFAEVADFIDTPVKRYSSGMYVRLAFAVAAHLEPDILIVDEVLAVGDAAFQKKCLGKIQEVSVGGRTVLIVSHNMTAIKNLATRCIVLSRGKVAFDGDTVAAIKTYAEGLAQAREATESLGQGSHSAIKSLRILDGDGAATINYIAGEQFRLEAIVWTDGGTGISLDIVLSNAEGLKLGFSSLSMFHGFHLPSTPGLHRVVLELEPLWLATGEYVLDISTSIAQSTFDHYVEALLRFQVLSCNPGDQSWDYRQSYNLGSIALRQRRPAFLDYQKDG